MKNKYSLIVIGLTFIWNIEMASQNSNENDSLLVCKTVSDFFNWYINAVKQGKHSEFQPVFVESQNGMTALNFSKYFDNLSKYGFSDSLLLSEKLSYQHCMDELAKLKYSVFITKFSDLTDFENIECDFSNYYRWTGGQEPIDGIRIVDVKFNNPFAVTLHLDYLAYNTKDKKSTYWGNNIVTMTKTKGKWKIGSITWR